MIVIEHNKRDLIVSFGLISCLGIMVVPIAPVVLDTLLVFSLGISVVVFFLTVNVKKPLEFATFPTVLLVSTLLRLALNVATTRLILTHGSEGESAAGQVVRAFAHVILGGNYVIGLVTFIILVTINFVVITKGAGRISEVAARFTLDALPGRQMSIDAELAAGHISEKDAKIRRNDLERETDFYGAMDGASKFVRGDAVAAIIITGINIVGGFLVGVLQQNMDIAKAAEVYTVLSVGDGLVSQLPALLVSTAAGLLSTRAASGQNLTGALANDLLTSARPLQLGAVVLTGIGLMPGMPHFTYFIIAFGMYRLSKTAEKQQAQKDIVPAGPEPMAAPAKNEVEEALQLSLLELEVGFELVPLVDASKNGELLRKVHGVRKQLAHELGIIVPSMSVRDNLRLKPAEYRLLLSGNEIARGEVRLGKVLAMSAARGAPDIGGEPTVEPAFGIEARWIPDGDRIRAERFGYTTVEPATVITTHLSEVLRTGAQELFGRKEAQQLFDLFSQEYPKLLEELMPAVMTPIEVVRILRLLLREGQSIRDLRTIVEALLETAPMTKDPEQLVEAVRQKLARHITARFKSPDGRIHGLFLEPSVEDTFRQVQRGVALQDPRALERVMGAVEKSLVALQDSRYAPLIVTAPDVRRSVATLANRYFPGVNVISTREIDSKTSIVSIGVVAF